jgi:hypothetical protein
MAVPRQKGPVFARPTGSSEYAVSLGRAITRKLRCKRTPLSLITLLLGSLESDL